jgi:hypothetical protein
VDGEPEPDQLTQNLIGRCAAHRRIGRFTFSLTDTKASARPPHRPLRPEDGRQTRISCRVHGNAKTSILGEWRGSPQPSCPDVLKAMDEAVTGRKSRRGN